MSIIEDAAQLVKYNSIQGNKMNDIDVVYTMWGNLHKTEGMEVGQVKASETILFQNDLDINMKTLIVSTIST